MKRVIMGCAVAAMVALSARSEARPSDFVAYKRHAAPKAIQSESGTRVGIASWYGEQFQGNLTANGEVFDMNGLTAASRELPLGTRIQVKNLNNNRSIVLRINDRGPYIPGRVLDVSKSAAERLGFLNAGLAHIEMKVVRYPKSYLRGNQKLN
jgi:rare lipoprotein A (peptidoglycan hydrolase)